MNQACIAALLRCSNTPYLTNLKINTCEASIIFRTCCNYLDSGKMTMLQVVYIIVWYSENYVLLCGVRANILHFIIYVHKFANKLNAEVVRK
jgi:hypothetical protein